MKKIGLTLLASLFLLLSACSAQQAKPEGEAKQGNQQQPPAQQVELMVLAAASLTDALTSLKTIYENDHPGVTLTFSFGSSGKLAQQIEQGAPADLFLSASQQDMNKLDEKQLILKDTRVDFSGNSLVLVTEKDSAIAVSSFEDLTDPALKHIALGAPETVPAGRYTKEVLENLKLWDTLTDRLVYGSDVRQVLTFVEAGNAEVGVVYASDAAISKNVKVLATSKPEWHKPIVYPGAVIGASANADAAKAFLAYLTSEEGKKVLGEYGFQ
ncbi:molybdate ABC transporter substrate-binding protein [Brevibacillus invocatus]|uniref:molybdate ABC transporter substrate-binding protein n=1 Tax=Brevibacillus invocatus TaxID=173959 RepID=UPI00203DABA8|nr:molybdate ABC transporter substrate-binding protein [Brevibacillus invocatus]MCM3080256.1 molybdate ABC transporter substrate-binding protein [Brevibacillus invocatus]MCM3430490.1 molybdate ABC transporter substrate-binding protein [Brevibacillus invocatus]